MEGLKRLAGHNGRGGLSTLRAFRRGQACHRRLAATVCVFTSLVVFVCPSRTTDARTTHISSVGPCDLQRAIERHVKIFSKVLFDLEIGGVFVSPSIAANFDSSLFTFR